MVAALAADSSGNLLADAGQAAGVNITVGQAGCANADHGKVGLRDRLGRIAGGLKTACCRRLGHKPGQARLDDWRFALVDQLDFHRLRIDADDGMPALGEARG